jgi:hypothetical protein
MSNMDCKKEENLLMCNCTYPCSKKGICCECVAYHRKARQIPACFFSKEAEQSYDRSFEYFAELVNNKQL